MIYYREPWHIAYKATDVRCSDGKVRTAKITNQPDTFFSCPASVRVGGVWVSGYLTSDEQGQQFHRILGRKNSHLLPDWEAAETVG